MHENTREWQTSSHCSSQSVAAHLRVKRPLSTGDRELTSGRISGRIRSKSIHSTHDSVIKFKGLAESLTHSNNNNKNTISNNNNNNFISNKSNTNNEWNNESINRQTSDSNVNYLFSDYADNDGVMSLSTTSGMDVMPTFDYLNSSRNQFNSLSNMPSIGQYMNSGSHSCPTFNANFKHNYCLKNNNLKSILASNTFTSTNDKELKIIKAFPHLNKAYIDEQNDCKHDINNDNNSNKQILIAKTEELRSSNGNNGCDEMTTNTNCSIKSTSILKQLLRSKVTTNATLNATENCNYSNNTCHSIPTKAEKAQFRRSLDSATNLVFHRRNGLPLTSSPAPIRKSGTCFDFDSSLTSVNAIKKALFEKDPDVEVEKQEAINLSTSAPASTTISSLLGNFEESVLNGRLEPASTVHGFTAEIGASGSFCPRHKTLPVTVFFYTLQDTDKADKVSSPYLGHINLGKKGYHIPRKGTVQATLFNPHGTVVKMFVVRYDLSDMPPNSQTFLRQRTLFMPSDANENDADNRKWLRYLIHLRFESSKSGRIYLHTDVRIIVFRKHDLDVATINGLLPYELRSFTTCPVNPKYS